VHDVETFERLSLLVDGAPADRTARSYAQLERAFLIGAQPCTREADRVRWAPGGLHEPRVLGQTAHDRRTLRVRTSDVEQPIAAALPEHSEVELGERFARRVVDDAQTQRAARRWSRHDRNGSSAFGWGAL